VRDPREASHLTNLRPGGIPDPTTVAGSLLEAARRWPAGPALVVGDRSARYDELWAEALDCSRALLAAGLEQGEAIGLFLPNCWEYAVLFYAANIAGLRPVALNARFGDHELAHALRTVDFGAVFTTADTAAGFNGDAVLFSTLAALDEAERPSLVIDVSDSGGRGRLGWRAFLAAGRTVPDDACYARLSSIDAGDDCLIMFSSGTTSRPKACRLSHRSLRVSGEGLAERFRLTSADRFWDPLPFFHMSTMLPMTACRLTGACFVGVDRFEAGAALAELERLRATIAYPAFSTITAALISHPAFKTCDLSALRVILNVGPPDLLRRFQSAFPQAVQVSCYGLTECGGLSFYNDLDETLEQRVTTCGRPIVSVEVRIVDPLSGDVRAAGETGEIQLRGAALFSGYLGDPDATCNTMTADGWLRTGDAGTLDAEGRVAYAGRFKDMLRIGGENVAATEIESFLVTHPAIKLAQVVGVPDDRLDEVPAAFIELEAGASLQEIDVARFCAHRIASYKIPRYVRIVTDWPMSATKIQKVRLAEQFSPDRKIAVSEVLRETGQSAAT